MRAMRRVLAYEKPDLIYVWNMGGLTRSLLEVAHAYPAPVVYEIFDGWLSQPPDVCEWAAFWQRPSLHPIKRYMKRPARLLAGRLLPIDLPVLDLGHIVFKSQDDANSALQHLQTGAAFEQLACRAHSATVRTSPAAAWSRLRRP